MIRTTKTKHLTQVDWQAAQHPPANSGQMARVIFVSAGFRLDNRDQLIADLALPSDASNEAILVHGWAEWSEDLPDRLRGAFAFALYLPEDQSIFGARDIFGLSAFYYAFEGGILCLGSTCRDVRSTLPGQGTPNELMLADFVNDAHLENEQTFFTEITRLPQAHLMKVSVNSLEISRYWFVERVKRDQSPPDAARRFRTLFDAGVAHCIEDKNPVLLISGGMDSSAIAASLRIRDNTAPLHAAAMTFHDSAHWEDRTYLEDIVEHASLDLMDIPTDEHNPLAGMMRWLEAMDGPYLPRGWSMTGRLFPLMNQRGFDVVLSGHGGDEIVSFGFGRLNELAMRGQWLELWRQTGASSGLLSEGPRQRWLTFKRYFVHLPPYRLLRSLRWALGRLIRGQSKASPPGDQSWLSPQLESRIDLSRYNPPMAVTRRDHTDRMLQEDVMSLGVQSLSLEVFGICARDAGVEIRFPFYDRDLYELSLSLASDWKLRDGFSRYILRAAMGDDLPKSIRERVNKNEFTPNFLAGLWAAREELLQWTDPSQPGVEFYANRKRLDKARDKLSHNEMRLEWVEAFFLWRVAVLAMWLEVAKQPITAPKLSSLIEE